MMKFAQLDNYKPRPLTKAEKALEKKFREYCEKVAKKLALEKDCLVLKVIEAGIHPLDIEICHYSHPDGSTRIWIRDKNEKTRLARGSRGVSKGK